jgi:hypothetical protein
MAEEKDDRFTRPNGEGKTYSTPRLPKKKGETKDNFYKRMNELGYGKGDLEKVPHHWNSDDNEMHPGESSESCKWCKPTKRQQSKSNKKEGEIPDTLEAKKESTPTGKSSEGGSETPDAKEDKPFDRDDANDVAEGKYLKKTSLAKLEKKVETAKRKRGRPSKKKKESKAKEPDSTDE